MIKFAILPLILVGITACGSKPKPGDYSVKGPILADAKQVLAARAYKKAGVMVGYKALTKEQIDAFKLPLIRVNLPKLNRSFIANEVARNGAYVTYKTTESQAFVFNRDRLVATRGFHFDLMARSLNNTDRKYQYISPEHTTAELSVTCENQPKITEDVKITDVTYSTTSSSEVCKGTVASFKNEVWRSKSGKIRKAHQWVGPEMGFAVIEYLN